MPELRLQAAHRKCFGVAEYLRYGKGESYFTNKREGKTRVRAFGGFNLAGDIFDWDQQMDETREMAGNDLPYRGRRARTYNHFVLSPDPADGLSYEDVLALAEEYAAHFFGDGEVRGTIGQFESAIIIHDDGTNNVVHAHVIVNNTDLDTLKRIHRDRRDIKEMYDFAEELAKSHGYHSFTETHESVPAKVGEFEMGTRIFSKPRPISFAERHAMEAHEGYSWKEDLAQRVRVAYECASDMKGFVLACKDLGVTVEKSKAKNYAGDFLYRMADEPTHCCRANKLGTDYRSGNLTRHFARNEKRGLWKPRDGQAAEVAKVFWPKGIRRVGNIEKGSGISLHEAFQVIDFMREVHVSDYTQIKRIRPSSEDMRERLERFAYVAEHAHLKVRDTTKPAAKPQAKQSAPIVEDGKIVGTADAKTKALFATVNKQAAARKKQIAAMTPSERAAAAVAAQRNAQRSRPQQAQRRAAPQPQRPAPRPQARPQPQPQRSRPPTRHSPQR